MLEPLCENPRKLSANRSCTGLSPIPAACVATNALAELKWSGTSEEEEGTSGGRRVGENVLPLVSRRSERRGLLSSSCPDTLCPSKWWSHGESHPDLRNAIASSCSWTMAPKWSARPDSHRVRAGLQAAASTISASRAFEKWGGRRVLPPLGDLHRIECWLLHHGLHLKVIRLRVPPPSGLAYKASA